MELITSTGMGSDNRLAGLKILLPIANLAAF
jgi:hypothetical protein